MKTKVLTYYMGYTSPTFAPFKLEMVHVGDRKKSDNVLLKAPIERNQLQRVTEIK